MSIRLAAVQPRSFHGPEEERNLEEAVRWVDRAAAAGADLVLFPEGYPGPTNPGNTYDAVQPLADAAARAGVHVVAGAIEPAESNTYYVVLRLIGGNGELIGTYRRATPPAPYEIYRDIPAWQFDYVHGPENDLPVFDTALGRIGLQVCSEVYSTESSRVLTLKGAEIILYPAGGAINELLPAWRTMVWARAIENLIYTAAVQNIYSDLEEGVGTIASPERVLAQSTSAGLLLADLSLERLRFLREEDERIEFPKRYKTVPGVLRWRRPELYGVLLEEPLQGTGAL